MTYAITNDNRLEQGMELSVSGSCGTCGAPTSEATQRWALAGRIAVADLVEAASVRADGPAACGHPLAGLTGMVSARLELPGGARWLGANIELGHDDPALRLVSVDPADLGSVVPSQLPAGSDDYEVARRIGQPASVAAAWHGALLADRLGYPAHFPCGPNLTLLVADDAGDADRRAAGLGLDGDPVRLADCAGPAGTGCGDWIYDERQLGRMWAVWCPRGLALELIGEARAQGLGVQSADGRLRLTCRSELLFEELALGPVVERAIAGARHPRVEAAHDLLVIRRRLARRSEVLQAVLRLFEPDDWRMAGDGRGVIMRRGGAETALDLSQLAVANPATLPQILRSALTDGLEGEIPGETGARS